MSARAVGVAPGSRPPLTRVQQIVPDLLLGWQNLMLHKLRSLLTMLGMIFGVGAVVAMLSITAGAQRAAMSYIDLLGVNNIIIEAKEAADRNELQARRAISPGLTFRDYRAISETVQGIEAITPRKRFKPLKVLPKTAPGLSADHVRQQVLAHLPETLFPGGAKAGWWTKAVQLDLEAKGIIVRESAGPLRLRKA